MGKKRETNTKKTHNNKQQNIKLKLTLTNRKTKTTNNKNNKKLNTKQN